MFNGTECKRKSTMVLFQLEESLGKYILRCETNTACLSENFLNDISNRSKSTLPVNTKSMQNILEETYLSEIFHIALQTANDTSEYEKINALKDLFRLNKIFDIRNSLAHPNRPFLPVYWYRIASVASDPLIESLALDEVYEALEAAESGRIVAPPEDWTMKHIWQIKNNLPAQFEHDITGLVGRKKEIDDLRKLLGNPRNHTIAIVAPGGIGKTALALDLLHSLVSEPQTSEWAEVILFISMKTDRLTADGIEKLNAVDSIEQIRETIRQEINLLFNEEFTSFDDVKDKDGNKKVFIFIDNLETLLRDSEEAFTAFNNSLPLNWRLLVTSRISITNASIVPLNPLKKASAIQLAKVYSNRTTHEQLDQDVLEKIVINSYSNPLSIRLTIDLFNMGKEIPISIDIANKEIAAFSYNNLIETISQDGITVLETLFIQDTLTRNALCEIWQKDLDEITSAIKELTRTSLIKRIQNDEGSETYSLNSSVRDLLLRNPRNIACRKEVQDQLTRQKMLSIEIEMKQQTQGIQEFHLEYIPYDLNSSLKILLGELNKALRDKKGQKQIITLFNKFDSVKSLYDKEFLYHRGLARVYTFLSDTKNAVISYTEAIKLNNQPIDKIMLATIHRKNTDFTLAREILEPLMRDKELFANLYLGRKIISEYFRACLYDHDYNCVLKYTENWEKASKYSGLLGCYRASAWKRKVEGVIDSNELETVEALTNAVITMHKVLTVEGYFNVACTEAIKIMDEIEFCLHRQMFLKHHDNVREWLKFISDHIVNIVESYKNYLESDAKLLVQSLQKIETSENPFQSERWNEYTKPTFENAADPEEAFAQGYTICRIYNIPEFFDHSYARNIFAEDQQSTQYYIHVASFKGSWEEWKRLKVGMKIAIKFDDVRRGKTLSASETLPINP